MALRSRNAQSLHDRVIRHVAEAIKGYDVYTNPGQEKNFSVKGLYPDVVVCLRGTYTVVRVLEVETADTVTFEHAREQWIPYSTLPNFCLVVPYDMLNVAREICRQLGIRSVSFGYFVVDPDGRIRVIVP